MLDHELAEIITDLRALGTDTDRQSPLDAVPVCAPRRPRGEQVPADAAAGRPPTRAPS